MASDPSSIPTCTGDNLTGLTTVDGYRMCAGTPGNFRASGNIPNNEDVETRQYINFFSSLSATPKNPCIVQFVPSGTTDPRNVVPYANVHGGCSLPSDFPDPKPAANNRITRLTPFTTASKVGAFDDGGMSDGVPTGLLGMTKVWGVDTSATKGWTHGGVHANNVGSWWRDLDGKPFVVKYNGKTWTQDTMLWCRMTGDNYDATKDPYSGVFPAPPGVYLAVKTEDQRLPFECAGSDPAITSGQIIPNSAAPCKDPYKQVCAQGILTEEIMRNPNKIVKQFGGKNQLTAYQTSNPQGRVGGCFSSADMYGPGKFSVLINLPPTAVAPDDPLAVEGYPAVDAVTGKYPATGPNARAGGRGYVFSIWTFAYSEAYAPYPPGNPDGVTTMVGNMQMPNAYPPGKKPNLDGVPIEVRGASGKLETDTTVQIPYIQGVISGDAADGYYAEHNHEIDIEIPANSGQVVDAGNALKDLGLNTANFNTWLTDQDSDSYTAGTKTLYQQAQVTAPTGQFFASVGPGETDEDFHEFSYVWYVDPDEEALPPTADVTPKSYVAFYRDGVELFKCHRFVPRRSGRVVVGFWPAWWGPVKNPMTFNHVYAKIARLEFVPQADITNTPFPRGALVTNAAQTYDELTPTGSDVKCGLEIGISQRQACSAKGVCRQSNTPVVPGPGTVTPGPGTVTPGPGTPAAGPGTITPATKSSRMSAGTIAAIVLGSIAVVGFLVAVIMYIIYVQRATRKTRAL